MKKMFIVLFILVAAYAPVKADFSAERLFRDLTGLVNSLTKTISAAQEAVNNAVKVKMFTQCFKAKDIKNATVTDQSNPTRVIACKDVTVPLIAIQAFLSLIKEQIIGSSEAPGLIYTVLDILSLAGLEDQIKPVQEKVQDVLRVINSINTLLEKAKTKLRVV